MHTDKITQNTTQTAANTVQKKSDDIPVSGLVDNRPEAITQLKLREVINNSTHVQQMKAYQEMVNNSPQVRQLNAYRTLTGANTQKGLLQLKSTAVIQMGGCISKPKSAQPPPDPRILLALTINAIRGFQRHAGYEHLDDALKARIRTSGELMGTYQMNIAWADVDQEAVLQELTNARALLAEVKAAIG